MPLHPKLHSESCPSVCWSLLSCTSTGLTGADFATGDRPSQLLPLKLINLSKTCVFVLCLLCCFYRNFPLCFCLQCCRMVLLSLCLSPPLHCTPIPAHRDFPPPPAPARTVWQKWKMEAGLFKTDPIPMTTTAKAVWRAQD